MKKRLTALFLSALMLLSLTGCGKTETAAPAPASDEAVLADPSLRSDYVTDDKGRVLKTLGRKNLHFQRSKFNHIAQPYYGIIDADGNVLTKNNYSYSRDVNKFVEFLKEGVSNFSKK